MSSAEMFNQSVVSVEKIYVNLKEFAAIFAKRNNSVYKFTFF